MPRFPACHDVPRRVAIGWVICALALLGGRAQAGSPRIAFLAAEASAEDMGPHNRGAWLVASKLGEASLLLRQKKGHFADTSGRTRHLSDFDVVWYHQGDAIRRTAMYRGPSLTALRAFAAKGGGVLLSGGALAIVDRLGLEPDIRAQRHNLGNYWDPAGMVPVETTHPAFSGLVADDGIVWLSRRGCRAVADFYWGGPAEGMVLAGTPSGPENPLVEYALGKGRLILFGWRWPDYADVENPHRDNLLRLTRNLLTYLAEAKAWRPVVIRSEYPPVAHPDEPGVSQQRWRALRMAIEDLTASCPRRYPNGGAYLKRLEALRTEHDRLPKGSGPGAYADVVQRFEALQREALLSNPLLDFDSLLLIRRRASKLGLPKNYNGNADLPPTGYGNTLAALSPVKPGGELKTIYTPEGDRFIGDLDLHYDADRMLLSTPDAKGRWGVAELDLKTRHLKRLPLIDEPDVHNYDACYLPDGRIVFTSTAPFVGVPCVGGRSKVANLYLRELDGSIRRLTNDQDHNWCPTVLNNGRILYQRWEYADIAHAFTRLLFHANPDGSQQMEYYGSNSFWPTAMFYARPVPGHPTKVVTVVGGHHDAPRQGELVVLDPAKGRHEASGVVQRIPGWGKDVEPVILDGLIGTSWPRFLHPFPLGERGNAQAAGTYFLVSCKPTKTSLWGVYLVDVFDNFVLIHEEPGWAMLEPTPLKRTPRQRIVPDVVEPGRDDATVLLVDVYRGDGLKGVPRGTVKSLRLFSYAFTFHGLGGEPDRVGFDGPWDVKRIVGTVPVASDGSAYFCVPACTPIAVQPLDAEGKSLALMRSWFTAMPGEVLSCVGCHEPQDMTPPVVASPAALEGGPDAIKPWYGPARGFSFQREVQPVLDAYCVECHNGKPREDGSTPCDLTARPPERVRSAFQMRFTPSYTELRRFVHSPTLESDAHLLPPMAFHADTSKLVQILRDGHHGVSLSDEAWDRLITWIDLHAPAHGTWAEVVEHIPAKLKHVKIGAKRRREMNRRYAGFDRDPEAVYPAAKLAAPGNAVGRDSTGSDATNGVVAQPAPAMRTDTTQSRATGPHVETRAGTTGPRKVTAAKATGPGNTIASQQTMRVDLGAGVSLELVRIPAGRFVMGSNDGYANERPAHGVAIGRPFWIGRTEVSNRQYACFDPHHHSGLETGEQYAFGDDERGHHLYRPEQPVVRVSWHQAVAFCTWLSGRTDKRFTLPTEAQWEYACRAGTTTPLWYGGLDDDFSGAANLSDATHHTVDYPHVPTALPPWRPAETRFDDTWRVSAPVGTFRANPWGLFDMHGNVAEWTRSAYRPYPYEAGDGRNDEFASGRKVVRGGSWYDRPLRARSSFRLHYEAYQPVHDVGFRVACEDR